MNKLYILIILFFCSHKLNATTWHVGPTQTYTAPSQVSTLVSHGDTVLIDAGTYNNDVALWTANNLVLKGAGGFAHLKANGSAYGGKAIWVIAGNNTIVDQIEFSLCSVPDHNGAGIRQEGHNLTVTHCYFHDNENGILAGAVNPSTINIQYSEFSMNGYGDGYTHNLYIGSVDTLIFEYNYSHHAIIGHELKSRAHTNLILYNRISDENTGTASRNIDLPDGGSSILIGNIIEQGPMSPNHNLIGFALESTSNPSPHQLIAINNTLVNHYTAGDYYQFGANVSLFKAYNNILAGNGNFIGATLPSSIDTMSNQFNNAISAFNFVNDAMYDYHLTASSFLALNNGSNPGLLSGFSLTPSMVYLHPHNAVTRCVNLSLDPGAHEFCVPNQIDESGLNDILFYPNPVVDFLFCQKQLLASMKVEIYSDHGVKMSYQISDSGIDFSTFNAGIYFLKVSNDSTFKVYKIVKQ